MRQMGLLRVSEAALADVDDEDAPADPASSEGEADAEEGDDDDGVDLAEAAVASPPRPRVPGENGRFPRTLGATAPRARPGDDAHSPLGADTTMPLTIKTSTS